MTRDRIEVYELHDGDWWAAKSLTEAILEARKTCGETYYPMVLTAKPLTDDEMKSHIFRDDDGSRRSFRDQLDLMIASGERFPCCFASDAAL